MNDEWQENGVQHASIDLCAHVCSTCRYCPCHFTKHGLFIRHLKAAKHDGSSSDIEEAWEFSKIRALDIPHFEKRRTASQQIERPTSGKEELHDLMASSSHFDVMPLLWLSSDVRGSA